VDSAGKAAGKGALIQTDKAATLAVAQDQYLFQPVSIENHPADSRVNVDDSGKVQTLTSRMGTGGGNVPMVMEPVAYNGENVTSPLNKTNPQPGDPCHTLGTDSRNYVVFIEGNGSRPSHQGDGYSETDTMYTLNTIERHAVAYAETYRKTTGPPMANSHPGSYTGQDAYNDMFVTSTTKTATVRRLTPTECERLQGYPDGWTDIGEWVDSKGKKHKEADSPRYKALGNSIALPFWKWLLKRISAQYERDATLGSLFDGIGGFPLCWEQINGKGSARWASEIEEFPMAVTRKRFEEAEE
jgi:DNA (cytosine-5)-methyltransferase 1